MLLNGRRPIAPSGRGQPRPGRTRLGRSRRPSDLQQRGKSEREIRRAVEQGRLQPVHKGHFASPGAPTTLIRAARVGGVATGTSAARSIGLWTPPDPAPGPGSAFTRRAHRLHVAVRRSDSRFRDPDDASRPLHPDGAVMLHRIDHADLASAAPFGVAPVLLLLEHCFRTLPPEQALAVVDSALHLRHLRRADLPELARRLPAALRHVVEQADGRADSGIETIARHLLRLAGLRVVGHPVLDGIGEVDLLVEGRLIVELDGREFHDDAEAFDRDRSRDLAAARSRYRVLRLTWSQVLFDWPSAEAAVFSALAIS